MRRRSSNVVPENGNLLLEHPARDFDVWSLGDDVRHTDVRSVAWDGIEGLACRILVA